MKTENILIILALFVVIFLLFSNFSVATPTAPIVFQTPSFLSNSFDEGPQPCPFPFGCGGKGRPGRGGWFPSVIGGRGRGGRGGRGRGGRGGGGRGRGGRGGREEEEEEEQEEEQEEVQEEVQEEAEVELKISSIYKNATHCVTDR